jgi:two-component system, OmpR family, response regulator MprA
LVVVERDAGARGAIGRALDGVGFDVVPAPDAAGLLAALGDEPPDMVVMGPELADLDGLELCRRLRASGHRMPILLVSVRDAVGDRVAGLEAGADDYLVRPFSPAELVARARALLRRARAAAHGGTLRLGDLALDPSGREASRGGRPLELTPREFDLLAHFLRNPDTVLTREHLQAEAWDQPAGSDTNAVDVYVGYLRRKLEAEGGARLIWTVRGVGYVLRESRA